jgi:hypothetical protein
MRHHIRIVAILLIVAYMMALPNVGIRAQSNTDPEVTGTGSFGLPPGEQPANTPTTVMLELTADANQQAVQQAAAALGAQQLYQYNLQYRGIAVRVPLQDVAALQHLNGVRAVHHIASKQRLRTREASLATAVQSTLHSFSATGKHIRIGIIDSGIDYTHATFGGVGTIAAFDAIDPTTNDPANFPSPKVAGGFDFAGDDYDADGDLGSAIPSPDPNPLDCRVPATTITLNRGGHGTHIASIAAGYGVVDGATYRGSYSSLPAGTTFDLAPGIAPEATLYAFKVFGCRGSTVLIANAISKAIDPNGDGDTSDRLVDVLNIAIGASFASADDPDSQAVAAAVQAGVTVVLAAGDSGNVFYAGSAPGNATAAVTIGALGVNGIADFSSRSPQPSGEASKPDLVAPGVAILGAESGSGIGAIAMDGTSMASAHAAGAAALALEKRPFWSPSQIKGSLMSTATPLFDPSGAPYPVSLAGAGVLNVNAVPRAGTVAFAAGSLSAGGLSFNATSLPGSMSMVREIAIYNGDAPQVVQLRASTIVSETGVTVTVPNRSFELFQCEYTYVPVTITIDPSQLGETPDDFTPLRQGLFNRYYLAEHSGLISVKNAPFARLRIAHAADAAGVDIYIDDRLVEPGLSHGQVGEWAMRAAGLHRVRVLPKQASPDSVAPIIDQNLHFNADLDSTIVINGTGSSLAMKVVEANRVDPADSLVQFFNGYADAAVDIALNGEIVAANVQPLATTSQQVASAGKHTFTFYRVGTNEVLASKDIQTNARQNYFIGLTQKKSVFAKSAWNERVPVIDLNVPFQLFPKSAAQANVAMTSIQTTPDQTVLAIPLNNVGARNQLLSPRGAQIPLVAAFELAASSPVNNSLNGSAKAADLQHVGVTSNYAISGSVATTALFFATASYHPWTTPNQVQFRVYLDTTGPTGVPDGVDDYLLISTNWGAITNTQPSDVFLSPLYRIVPDGTLEPTTVQPSRYNSLNPPNAIDPSSVDAAPYNTRVAFQFILARFIGLTDAQPTFRYRIETRARSIGDFGIIVDRVPATGYLEYRINAPALTPINAVAGVPNLQQRPLFLDVQGGNIQAKVNQPVLAARGSQGILIMHLHNPPANQVETVQVLAP